MGLLVSGIDALIEECAAAGVVFHPKAGQLRPELTRGRPPDELLARVKAQREGVLLRLAELMDFGACDEGEGRPRRASRPNPQASQGEGEANANNR